MSTTHWNSDQYWLKYWTLLPELVNTTHEKREHYSQERWILLIKQANCEPIWTKSGLFYTVPFGHLFTYIIVDSKYTRTVNIQQGTFLNICLKGRKDELTGVFWVWQRNIKCKGKRFYFRPLVSPFTRGAATVLFWALITSLQEQRFSFKVVIMTVIVLIMVFRSGSVLLNYYFTSYMLYIIISRSVIYRHLHTHECVRCLLHVLDWVPLVTEIDTSVVRIILRIITC